MKLKQKKNTAATSKTVQAKNATKTKAQTAKAVAFQTVKQVYRAWRKLDLDGYRAQGEATVAAMRAEIQVKKVDVNQSMVDFVAIDCGAQMGFAIIGGKILKNDTAELEIHAGKVVWKMDKTKHKVVYAGNYKGLLAYVQKHGEGAGESKKHGKYENALGRTSAIGFCVKGGRLARLEDNNSKNGKSWKHSVIK